MFFSEDPTWSLANLFQLEMYAAAIREDGKLESAGNKLPGYLHAPNGTCED